MEEKYYITVYFKDGDRAEYVGVGRPSSNPQEIQVKSPDGQEIIIDRSEVKLFIVNPYSWGKCKSAL